MMPQIQAAAGLRECVSPKTARTAAVFPNFFLLWKSGVVDNIIGEKKLKKVPHLLEKPQGGKIFGEKRRSDGQLWFYFDRNPIFCAA